MYWKSQEATDRILTQLRMMEMMGITINCKRHLRTAELLYVRFQLNEYLEMLRDIRSEFEVVCDGEVLHNVQTRRCNPKPAVGIFQPLQA